MDLSFPALSIASAFSSVANALPANPIAAVDARRVVEHSAAYSARAAEGLAAVSRPVSAAAAGTRVSAVHTTAKFLGRALPWVVLSAGSLQAAKLYEQGGKDALLHTKAGRGAVLGAIGGGLLMIPAPPAQLASAGVLALSAANTFDGLKRFDRPVPGITATSTSPTPAAGSVATAA